MKKLSLFLLVILLFNCKAKQTLPVSEEPCSIRAVWIPDPSHTSALTTYENVLNTVKLVDELNMNAIYVCAWAKVKTVYPSPWLVANSTYSSLDETYMLKNKMENYNVPIASLTGDPLKDLIVEAHKRNIKVILWFEYGFMGSHGETPADNPLLAKNPQWASKGNDGKQSNYNKTDYYFNAYHPDLQEFMIKLIEEALVLYPDVDGIQGDDRMPAMPRNSGYDDYTVAQYKAAFNGDSPPSNFNDSTWVRWRLDILNDFAKRLHSRVKAVNANAIVCFSPNPYPWCMDNLMQEWPKWVADQLVDVLSVQCYRNNDEAYKSTVETADRYVKTNTNKSILNPGIILKNGSVIMSEDLLSKQLQINRTLHTMGEAYFYNEGLKDSTVQKVLKKAYPTKAVFPK